MTTYVFHNEIHVLDKADGTRKCYRLLRDLACTETRGKKVRVFAAHTGYDTDFASIPTKMLKELLSPSGFTLCRKYKPGIKWAVWIYRDTGNGPFIVGYRSDPIAYAAVIHDIIVAAELLFWTGANRVFAGILRQAHVVVRMILNIGVLLGCWHAYAISKSEEVKKLRELSEATAAKYAGNACS